MHPLQFEKPKPITLVKALKAFVIHFQINQARYI